MKPSGRTVKRKLFIEPKFHQTDMMGVVHNVQYLLWFEEGRLQILWDILPLDEAVRRGIMVPVVHVDCTYKSYARFGEPLVLYTTHTLVETYTGKLAFEHTLCHRTRKTEIACGKTVVTIVDRASNQLVKDWPRDLWERYRALS
jgi:acyl-CoA thioester hydrolase